MINLLLMIMKLISILNFQQSEKWSYEYVFELIHETMSLLEEKKLQVLSMKNYYESTYYKSLKQKKLMKQQVELKILMSCFQLLSSLRLEPEPNLVGFLKQSLLDTNGDEEELQPWYR